MARLQIPLDALTSRFSLGDRFASVRSQSITSRFANLKPISEFFDIKRVSKPANFSEIQSRVNYNLSYFSSNYAVVFVMLSIYSLLTNLTLLFVIILAIGGTYGIGKLEGRDLDIGVVRATSSQLYTGLLVVCIPLGLWASPIGTALWLIGATGVTVLGHASFMDKPIEDAFSEEALEDSVRVEELDSDDYDNDEGVPLNPYMDQRFMGTEYNPRARRKGNYDYDDDGEESTDDDEEEHGLVDGDPGSTMSYAMQLARRDKNDRLVERALQKVRRARMQGQTKVMLSQRELDALERKRQQDGGVNGAPRKEASSRPAEDAKPNGLDKRLPNGSSPAATPARKRSNPDAYASSAESPRGYYAPTAVRPSSSSSSRPRSRAGSIQSSRTKHSNTPPRGFQQPMYPQPLPYSVPEDQTVRPGSAYQPTSRPPNDPTRMARSRSSSNSFAYPIHQSPYHTYPLPSMDPRYGIPAHPNVPPPINTTYQPVYRSVSGDSYLSRNGADPFIVQPASAICESPRRMRGSSGSSSSDNGVQVDVTDNQSARRGHETRGANGTHSRGTRRRKRHHREK
ncbi:hypothetical protein FQN52_009412 [Onygenales sp. PD_12]|nr:hypothetical protein FQN52_009412 [Onygenales sp. PD_12]